MKYIGLPVTGESDGAYWNAVTVDIQLLNARIEHVLTRGFKTYISILFLPIKLKISFWENYWFPSKKCQAWIDIVIERLDLWNFDWIIEVGFVGWANWENQWDWESIAINLQSRTCLFYTSTSPPWWWRCQLQNGPFCVLFTKVFVTRFLNVFSWIVYPNWCFSF